MDICSKNVSKTKYKLGGGIFCLKLNLCTWLYCWGLLERMSIRWCQGEFVSILVYFRHNKDWSAFSLRDKHKKVLERKSQLVSEENSLLTIFPDSMAIYTRIFQNSKFTDEPCTRLLWKIRGLYSFQPCFVPFWQAGPTLYSAGWSLWKVWRM